MKSQFLEPRDAPRQMIDVVFDVSGRELPLDHRAALWNALSERLPSLAETPAAGVHAIRAARTADGILLLPRRAKLVLRVPQEIKDAVRSLEGESIEVAGNLLVVGTARFRTFSAAATLYSDFVTTGATSERSFEADVALELRALNVSCQFISGLARRSRLADGEVTGFALVLHGIPPDQSLVLQHVGLGRERRLGCGILVQHKAIGIIH
jgi:CRISPR-associated protein Cas6